MNWLLRISITSTSALAVASAFAATTFTPVKGVRELTGTMIVRPIQLDSMMSKSWSLAKINGLKSRVRAKFGSSILRYYPETDEYVVKVPKGTTESKYASALMATGDYQYATPRWLVYPAATPNDPQYPSQWHHATIQSPIAWNLWTGSNDFTVAVVDTGVLKTHEDLKDLLVSGYNSVDRLAESDGGQVSDVNGHGTHVAGCVSAHGNNSIGVAGVGWNFKIMPIRTSNAPGGGAFTDDMMNGARWAVSHGAKTISVSYAGVDDPSIGTTGTWIKQQGGLLLFAAGNDNRNLSGFSYADTIVVGASNQADGKADFSAYGKGVAVFTPGVDILSTTMDGGYQAWSGTSMATPVTNGACALIWSANPDLTSDDVQEILYSTCDNIGSSSIFGHGRINVGNAVIEAFSRISSDATISSVVPFTGAYTAGDLFAVRDTDLVNSYNVQSTFFRGLGEESATALTFTGPAGGHYRSIGLDATVGITGTKPATAMVYLYNYAKGKYEYLLSKSLTSAADVTLSVRIKSNASNYVGSDGTVSAIVRSVVPARFGTANSVFRLGYAIGHYSASLN